MSDMLDPISSLKNIFHSWWKIVLIAYIFSLVGLVASYLLPAKYQAQAVFTASIDFTEVNFENLVDEKGDPVEFTQYDEDLALQVVERVLMGDMDEAFAYAQTLDPSLTLDEFERDSQISRYQAKWYLRYRHASPEVAQQIVNYWANLGLEDLKAAQADGEAETFVLVELTRGSALACQAYVSAAGHPGAGWCVGRHCDWGFWLWMASSGLARTVIKRTENADFTLKKCTLPDGQDGPLVPGAGWLPLTSFPILSRLTGAIVAPFSFIPLRFGGVGCCLLIEKVIPGRGCAVPLFCFGCSGGFLPGLLLEWLL